MRSQDGNFPRFGSAAAVAMAAGGLQNNRAGLVGLFLTYPTESMCHASALTENLA
jgi:hypothetical protein